MSAGAHAAVESFFEAARGGSAGAGDDEECVEEAFGVTYEDWTGEGALG